MRPTERGNRIRHGFNMSNIQYTGYVYLWYDTRAKLFYLGGHKGKVEDSYICSNKMMLRAYNKRPDTFKFRVLEFVYGDNTELRISEQKWLDKIKDSELYWTPNIYNKTVRYYNQKKHASGGNGSANKGNSNCGGHNRKTWLIKTPEGEEIITSSLEKTAKSLGLSKGTLYLAYTKNRPVLRGPAKGYTLSLL